MKTIEELCQLASKLRTEAKASPSWALNIALLLESNNEVFEGPISPEDMEACYNYVLDQYDPNLLIKDGLLKPEELTEFIKRNEQNPFFSLIELGENGAVKDVVLWDTTDCELVGDFLSKKYKWKE